MWSIRANVLERCPECLCAPGPIWPAAFGWRCVSPTRLEAPGQISPDRVISHPIRKLADVREVNGRSRAEVHVQTRFDEGCVPCGRITADVESGTAGGKG